MRSQRTYNARADLCVVCPVTPQAKGYLFEVPLPDGLAVGVVVLSDHVTSTDWQMRDAEYAGAAPPRSSTRCGPGLKPLLVM